MRLLTSHEAAPRTHEMPADGPPWKARPEGAMPE